MHATQSEYMAASEAAMEAVWIRKFVEDLGVMPSINKPINMYCDNSAAIIFANEPGVMKGARHFLRRYHYVREQVESGEIKLIKVHTDKNLADALPRGKVNEHANGIGLRLASSFMHICDYLSSSLPGVLTPVRGESLKNINGFDVLLPRLAINSGGSPVLRPPERSINGFDMPLPVAVCSGLVNPLAPRKGKFHGGLRTISTVLYMKLGKLMNQPLFGKVSTI
ncbi:hypothetical protein Tco_0032165 [Tanacetum coccineum]